MDIEKRERMAAESILENESIRQGLDDPGVNALLDWGIACAKQIAADTMDFEDDVDAEEATYPRMKALRKMLAAVKGLYEREVDSAQREALLAEIAYQAAKVYGKEPAPLELESWKMALASQWGDTGQKINHLRALIEKTSESDTF